MSGEIDEGDEDRDEVDACREFVAACVEDEGAWKEAGEERAKEVEEIGFTCSSNRLEGTRWTRVILEPPI